MKKILSVILSLLFVLGLFAGCDKKASDTDSSNDGSSTDTVLDTGDEVVSDVSGAIENFDGEDVELSAEQIEKLISDAIAKTDECGTFEVVSTMTSDYDGEKSEEKDGFKVKKQGDVYTYYREYAGYNPMDGDYFQKYYYNGKIGYESNSNTVTKIVSDVNFSKDFIYGDMDELAMFQGIHKEVSKNSPSISKDGAVYKIAAKISFDKLGEFLGEEVPDNVSGFYEFEYYISGGYVVCFAVVIDQNVDESHMSARMEIILNDIGTVEIEEPDFFKDFDKKVADSSIKFGEYFSIQNIENGLSVEYNREVTEDNEIVFQVMQIRTGPGSNAETMPDLECYKYNTEFQGYKVTSVLIGGFMTGRFGKIKRLVIPKGIYVETWDFDEPVTEVFFEDTKGEAQHDEIVGAKGVYYAGEWEYVNGLPTPKN